MRIHEIKEWPSTFPQLIDDRNPRLFEIRKNDRNYQVDDVLKISEWELHGEFLTGRYCYRRVTRVHSSPHLRGDFVILQFVIMDCPWELTAAGAQAIGQGAVEEPGVDVVKALRAPYREELCEVAND